MSTPIVVTCAANEGYLPSAAAMLHSVASHLAAPARLQVFVLADDLGQASRDRLARVTARFSVPTELGWLTPDVSLMSRFPLFGTWARTVLSRILVGSLLPNHVTRVMYLDTDIVVRADLSDLWVAPLHGRPIGAVRNQLPSTFGEHTAAPFRASGVPSATPYFNSGLLLIDLPAWRRDHVEERALECLAQHSAELTYADQDALNLVLPGNWAALPDEWNVLSTIYILGAWPESAYKDAITANEQAMLDRPKGVHYIGPNKPWLPGCTHPLRALFSDHLRRSGWDETAAR